MNIKVIDVRGVPAERRAGIEYVGRKFAGWEESPLSNRLRSLTNYRKWLWLRMCHDTQAAREICRLADKAQSGEPVILGCWCKSKGEDTPCHADIVKRAIEWVIEERGKDERGC